MVEVGTHRGDGGGAVTGGVVRLVRGRRDPLQPQRLLLAAGQRQGRHGRAHHGHQEAHGVYD